jgi:hypothetical protein
VPLVILMLLASYPASPHSCFSRNPFRLIFLSPSSSGRGETQMLETDKGLQSLQ